MCQTTTQLLPFQADLQKKTTQKKGEKTYLDVPGS